MVELSEMMERLTEAMEKLEETIQASGAAKIAFSAEAEESIGRIVATVETAREVELERKLAEAEAKIAELSAAGVHSGRKTLAGVSRMFAKDGGAGEGFDASAIDAALTSLTVEQRIAVKSELLRSGLVG